MTIFPGMVDREWLAYLADFPPVDYILAQHICAGALDAYQGRDCQIVWNVLVPSWIFQVVRSDAFDEYADDDSLEEIFGTDVSGVIIEYCPFCGMGLPALGTDTCLNPWDDGPPMTMNDVAQMLTEQGRTWLTPQ
jgi:hypothetical protein